MRIAVSARHARSLCGRQESRFVARIHVRLLESKRHTQSDDGKDAAGTRARQAVEQLFTSADEERRDAGSVAWRVEPCADVGNNHRARPAADRRQYTWQKRRSKRASASSSRWPDTRIVDSGNATLPGHLNGKTTDYGDEHDIANLVTCAIESLCWLVTYKCIATGLKYELALKDMA